MLGTADLVLLTPPAPETLAILAASDVDTQRVTELAAELSQVRYRPCISLALAYPGRIERPFYALVNIDRAHPISWLACEHEKGPWRGPDDQSLLIAQMAAQFSREHWNSSDDDLAWVVTGQMRDLLHQDLRAPLWCDVQRWPHALPDSGADFAAINRLGADIGLFFAGDYTAGLGRVHLAIESGWRAAELIAARARR
jgi:predicted NAD/FAD-dependent oxidoreductase